MFTEIKTEKVYLRVIKQIENLIKEGRLKPGDKLPPEKSLSEQLGVSRPSVREAIVGLEILGIVECKGGKGNFIKDIANFPNHNQAITNLETQHSPFELLKARKLIEVVVAEYAAQMGQKVDLEKIQLSLNGMRKTLQPKGGREDYIEFSRFDREFHINIAQATHNDVLIRIIIELVENLKEHMWINMKERSFGIPGMPQKTIKEHELIFSAIEAKNPELAKKYMLNHLSRIEKTLFGDSENN